MYISLVITDPSKSKCILQLKEIESHLSNDVMSIVKPLESDIVFRVFTVPLELCKNRIIIDLSQPKKQINEVLRLLQNISDE